MKIETRHADGFLRNPGLCRAILLHGDDAGLIRERGAGLVKRVTGSLTDPFQVVELEREGWPRLADEMTAISMMGGRRAIRVRDVTDAILEPLKAALKTAGDALIVLEAPELGKGKLRTFMEGAADAACVACYPEEGRALADTIRLALGELGVTVDAETTVWLAERLGGDRFVMRSELEKLALLAGTGGRVDLDLARGCTGDAAGSSADAGLLAATLGKVAETDAAVELALSEGLAAVALIRMAISHLQRLHQARLRMAGGLSASDAIRAMRPPVFFKLMGGMTGSLALWPEDMLARAIEEARQVEIACKQTGSRPDLLVRRFVTILARQSQARAKVRA
jgi:DNA polymerase-3 subunit delta